LSTDVDAFPDTGIRDRHQGSRPFGPEGLVPSPHRINAQFQRRRLLDCLTSTERLTA